MQCTEISSGLWIGLLAEAFTVSKAEGGQSLGKALSEKLCMSEEAAAGLLEGVELLGRYAMSEATDGQHAVDLESEAIEVSRQAVLRLFGAKVQRRLDDLDRETCRETRCPICGCRDESQGRRARPWSSLLGKINVKRRYRYCCHCGAGRAPSSEKLGLGEQDFTPRMEEVCTMVATTVPYPMAVTLMQKLAAVEVSETALQHMIARRGEALLQRESDQARTCAPFQDNGLPVKEQKFPADVPPKGPDVAYLEIDGVLPLTRTEVDDYTNVERQKQQEAKEKKVPGGKGRRYEIAGKEVKNAVLYDGSDCAVETPGRGCLLDKRYVSYLGDWRTFSLMVWTMMLRRGFHRAERLVILSDGADWIRSIADWLPVDALLILDLYHVKHRIWEVATVLYGKNRNASEWARTQCERIERGDARQVNHALRFLRPRCKEKKQKVAALRTYLKNNFDRMDYPRYRAMGLRVGSGAVESANYHVTGARLKLQGMRWSEHGARLMALLRADLFNRNWESTTKELLAA